MTMENFTPLFKEKNSLNPQFFFDKGEWIQCGESKIMIIYSGWVTNEKAHRFYDDDGFLVYGLKK